MINDLWSYSCGNSVSINRKFVRAVEERGTAAAAATNAAAEEVTECT